MGLVVALTPDDRTKLALLEKRFDELSRRLDALLAADKQQNTAPPQQKKLVESFAEFTLFEIKLGDLELKSKVKIDIGSLGRVIERIVELTTGFIETLRAYGPRVAKAVRDSADNVGAGASGVVGEFREFVRGVQKRIAGSSGMSTPEPKAPEVDVIDGRWPDSGCVFRDRAADGATGLVLPEMVVVPEGVFKMGSESGRENEKPVHEVKFARPFAVGRYAVTFDEWDAFVAAGGTEHVPDDRRWGRGRRPVINVSWDDAKSYVAWLSRGTGKKYRLLSEAEWEYAARAGSPTEVRGGKDANTRGSGSHWSGKQTVPVGDFKNDFGL